ncbi:MAG: ester cyclase [Actinobacteria bacterium]|nr:ester cyclase [Actinomycetota bacterium]
MGNDSGREVRLLRPPHAASGVQGVPQFHGVSGESAGSRALTMNLTSFPPGESSKAHAHRGYETAIYAMTGHLAFFYGDQLEHEVTLDPGAFLFIPPDVPHKAFNLSKTDPALSVTARNDPREQENVVPMPALDDGRTEKIVARAGRGRRRSGERQPATPHTETARRFYDAINAGDVEAMGAFIAEDYVEHELASGRANTKAATLEAFRRNFTAFPDWRMELHEMLPSGDKVVIRASVSGTHEAEFMGIPATGTRMETGGIDILGFGDDGLVHEHWGVFDVITLMRQLGVVLEAPGSGPR